MQRYYMHIPSKYFTEEIQQEYDIFKNEENEYVYVGIWKRIYMLKEAGSIAL